MELLLIRHSLAAGATAETGDIGRPLTQEGRALFSRAVLGLMHLGMGLDVVLHSPLLRAIQTAELLAPLHTGEREATPLLARPPGLDLLDSLLAASFSGDAVAAVGHQPHISELCALLVTGEGHYGGHLNFTPGTVAWLQGRPRPGQMTLMGLFSPQALAAAARS